LFFVQFVKTAQDIQHMQTGISTEEKTNQQLKCTLSSNTNVCDASYA